MWPKGLLPIVLLVFIGCDDGTGDPIHFIVPVGFEGVIQIVADGTDSGGYRHVNGRHEYTIPANGVLHVNSGRPFARWHKMSAADASGKAIPERFTNASDPDRRVIVGLGTSSRNGGPPVGLYAVGAPDFVARVEKWWNEGSGSAPPTPTTRPATQPTTRPGT